MAQLPGSQRPTDSTPQAAMPDVDALFPAQPKTVDELFPPQVERQTQLNTSPVQDFIFGDKDHNSAAAILDAFGQGAKDSWGASNSENLSKQAEEVLKLNKQLDAWNEGRSAIIKSANDVLFRPLAVQAVREAHDAQALYEGAGAIFSGTQAAVAKTGEVLGQPQLGREAAAAFEAFPTGVHAPTGMFHVPALPHELAAAKDLKAIGASEDAYFGTEPTTPEQAAAVPPINPDIVKPPISMPVDLFAEPRDAAPMETAKADAQAAEVPAPISEVVPTEQTDPASPSPIASDVAQKLQAAGRPAEEATASGQIIDAHYKARADRFGGALGTPEELYKAEGADIATSDGVLPGRSEPIKGSPDEGAAPVADEPTPQSPQSGGAAEAIETVPQLKQALRGRAAADPQTWSLYEMLAKEGGLKPTDDLKAILGGKNPLVPGFGPLLRPTGLTMDEALTRAKEHGYILDANDLQHTSAGNVSNAGENTVSVNTLHDMIDAESRGQKQYRTDNIPKEATVDPAEEARHIIDALHAEVEAATGQKAQIDPEIENRVVQIVQREGVTDLHDAFERAIMEDHDRHEALLNERRSTHGPIAGHDHPDSGTASVAGEKLASEGWSAGTSESDARQADGLTSRNDGEADRASRRQPLTAAEDGQPAPLSRVGLGDNIRRGAQQGWETGRIVKVGVVDGLKVEGTVPAEHWGDADNFILTKGDNVYRAIPHRGLTKLSDADGKALLERARKNAALELNQIKRGKIRLRADAKPIITLFKDANASTFIHETGHQWLEELMADAKHPKAPDDLKADASTILKWLGVDKAENIKTSHHEKFARGFERYMMEGKAPTQPLANVFAKFKNWLTSIYQTVTRLKSPINDEIRGVFDRLLTTKPEDVQIAPDEPAKTFADIHEADAEHVPPEMAHPAAETIQGERDKVAATHLPEEQDARLKNTPDQTQRSKAGNPQSGSDADATGSGPGEEGNDGSTGAVGPSGTETPSESPRPSKEPRDQAPVSAHDKFSDKAGNIRLENINTPADVLQVLRDSAARNNDFLTDRRSVMTDAQALSLAEAMGMDAAYLDTKQIGAAWNKEEIFALEQLLIKSSNEVHDAMNGTDPMAYGEARARFLMLHDMVQGKASAARAEAGRALQAYAALKKMNGSADAHQMAEALKTAGENKTLFQLEQEMKFGAKLQTPQQTAKFINDTSKGGKLRNAILEYYVNALISGPVTHLRYSVGNAVAAMFTPLVEIPMAAAVGKAREIATGEKIDRVHLGEAGAQLYSMVKGSRDGLNAAIEAFTSGVSPPLPTERVSPHFAQVTHAIPGTAGKIINIPSRSVAGIHSFFKTLRYEQNIQGQAFRAALQEGLTGDAFNARIADLTVNPTEDMMNTAREIALKELYMAPVEYHSFQGLLTRASNVNLAAKIIVPFMKIGTQITRNAFIERTPLGVFSKDIRENVASNSVKTDMQIGKVLAGTALMGSAVGMVLEGNMTGDGPADPAQRAVWLLSHRPNSIKIGDITVSYQGLGSLGMLMRFAANMTETASAMHDKDMATLATSFFEGFTTSVLDENFLRGVKDMTQAIYHSNEYGGSYIKSMVTNWMPWSVGSSQVARKIDPYSRETHGIFQAAQAKIPWLSEGLMPRRDMFGEPIRNDGPNPNYANDPVVKAMDSLGIGIGKMNKKINGIQLTEQQYDDASRIAGRMAKMRLNNEIAIISNPNIPAAQRVELIKSAIADSRRTARDQVMMASLGKENDIVRQSVAAKQAQLRPASATAH